MTILFTRDVYENEIIEFGDVDTVYIHQGQSMADSEVDANWPDDSYLYADELDTDEWVGLYSDLVAYVRSLKDELAAATERQLKLSEFVKTEITDKALSIRPSRSMYLTTEDAVRALQLYNLAQKAKDL
jgi:hypothetical protein